MSVKQRVKRAESKQASQNAVFVVIDLYEDDDSAELLKERFGTSQAPVGTNVIFLRKFCKKPERIKAMPKHP